MAIKKADNKKDTDDQMKKLRQTIDTLKSERLEVLQQLRMGTNSNVRKPTLIRRQIARTLTQLRQLETVRADAQLASLTTKEDA